MRAVGVTLSPGFAQGRLRKGAMPRRMALSRPLQMKLVASLLIGLAFVTGVLNAGDAVAFYTVLPLGAVFFGLFLIFNLLESFRAPLLHPVWRPNGGFLTPEQWTAALRANGFKDVRVFPDIAAIRDAYPSFAIAGIIARRD